MVVLSSVFCKKKLRNLLSILKFYNSFIFTNKENNEMSKDLKLLIAAYYIHESIRNFDHKIYMLEILTQRVRCLDMSHYIEQFFI